MKISRPPLSRPSPGAPPLARRLSLLGMGGLVVLAASCESGESPSPEGAPSEPGAASPLPAGPDLVLVTIDTLRADRVGSYGDPQAVTPNMDRLAAEGALFREAIAVAPLTLPSHASMLTNLLPAGHGLRDNGGFRLQEGVLTLAEALSEAGYRTGAFVSAYVLDDAWGLDQGFDRYRAPFHPQQVSQVVSFGAVEIPGADTVNAARAFLREGRVPGAEAAAPTFCWVHLFDPHTPWSEHPNWEGDPYRGEVAFADALLGRLLADVDEDDLVVVVGDHGESLWEHGEREHGLLLHRAATRVPLVIRPPGGIDGPLQAPAPRTVTALPVERPEGTDPDLVLDPVPDAPRAARVVEAPVSGVDVAATLADYGGVALPGDGVSLRAAVEGRAFERAPVYTETWYPRFHFHWSELFVVQEDRHRVRIGPQVERFDLEEDPTEAHPRPAPDDPLVAVARAGAGEGVPRPGPVPADAASRLAALGYQEPSAGMVSGTWVFDGDSGATLPDPRDRVGLLTRLFQVEGETNPLVRFAELQRLVEEHPDLIPARMTLANAWLAQGDAEAAWNEALAILERRPHHTLALNNAVAFGRKAGKQEEALPFARRMQAINPHDPRGYRLEVALWVDRQDPEAVIEAAQRALAVAPDDPYVNYLSGLASLEAGHHDDAIAALERARDHGSEARDIDLFVALAHERAGRPAQALVHYDRYIKDRPDDLRGYAHAGNLEYQQGNCPAALRYLENLVRRGVRNDPRVQKIISECSE